MPVDRGYMVKVSPVVRDDEGSVVLRQLVGDGLRLPSDLDLMPAPEALAGHADHEFRAAVTARIV